MGLSLGSPLLCIALRSGDIIHEPRAANRSRARVAVRKNSRFYLLVTEEADSVTIHNSPFTANSILRGDSLGISIIRRGGRPARMVDTWPLSGLGEIHSALGRPRGRCPAKTP